MRLGTKRMRKQRGDCLLIRIEENGFLETLKLPLEKGFFPFRAVAFLLFD